MMPAAEMIQAALAAQQGAGQGKADVEAVLAEALEGGAQQVDIEQAVAAIAGPDGAAAAADASAVLAAVPGWDAASGMAFQMNHAGLFMDSNALPQQDSVPVV